MTNCFTYSNWPVFELSTEELIGCCGIRPFDSEARSYEIGFHLRKKFWGMGYASEAVKAVIDYSFDNLKANKLFAGHQLGAFSGLSIMYDLMSTTASS